MCKRESWISQCVREERAVLPSETVLGFLTGFYFLLREWITISQGMNLLFTQSVCLSVCLLCLCHYQLACQQQQLLVSISGIASQLFRETHSETEKENDSSIDADYFLLQEREIMQKAKDMEGWREREMDCERERVREVRRREFMTKGGGVVQCFGQRRLVDCLLPLQ